MVARFQWYGAAHYCIQYEQDRYSSKIWARLHSARNIAGHEESKNMIKALGIPLDNRGLIYSRGWLAYADIRFNTKYPVLMSFMSHLTKLLMLKAHDDALHGGVAETLTQLHREFWMPRDIKLSKQLYLDAMFVAGLRDSRTATPSLLVCQKRGLL